MQCELRYEDGSKATKLEGLVNPLETFQEATGLWVAHALVNNDNGTRWVTLLNIHNEDIVTYRNTSNTSPIPSNSRSSVDSFCF